MLKDGPEYFHMVLIRNYPCTCKEELLREERKEIELINKSNRLNICMPDITSSEKNNAIINIVKNGETTTKIT